jgi:outer membrane biogenesis lipoprotein LolB
MLKHMLIAACIAAHTVPANAEIINLTTAINNKAVSFKATGSGKSYHDKALNLELENKTGKTVNIRVDTAIVFRPDDTSYQDIMLAGGDQVAIAPHKTVSLQTQSYCVKSRARGPVEGLNFSYAGLGDGYMIKLLAFIGREHINTSLAQDAVWVLANGHSLREIFDGDDPKSAEKLVRFMVSLTGQPLPTIYEEHKKVTTPGEVVYVPKALKMYAKFEWKNEKPKTMTLGVFDSAGKMIEQVFESKEIERGNHRATVEFESADVPAGKYYIRLMDGNTIFKEETVRVE